MPMIERFGLSGSDIKKHIAPGTSHPDFFPPAICAKLLASGSSRRVRNGQCVALSCKCHVEWHPTSVPQNAVQKPVHSTARQMELVCEQPTLWQATVVVRPMRQHSCHRAAAWSTAGALVDDNGRRAGSSRTRRAGAGAIRSAGCRGARRRGNLHTHSTCASLPGCCSPPAPVAVQEAGGEPASDGDDGALRQRPLGPSGPRRHRVLRRRVCSRAVSENALWRRVPPMNVPPKL